MKVVVMAEDGVERAYEFESEEYAKGFCSGLGIGSDMYGGGGYALLETEYETEVYDPRKVAEIREAFKTFKPGEDDDDESGDDEDEV